MRNNISRLLAVIFIGLISSCQDDRNNDMVNDQIGLLNPEHTVADIYMGDDTPYNLYVIKSGKGLQEADVAISVDESVLTDYNTNKGTSYQILPGNCYSILQQSLNFNGSDYRKAFEIKWNMDQLSTLQETTKYALPVQLKINNNSIQLSPERTSTIIMPQIIKPYLAFETPGLYSPTFMPTINDLEERELYVKVATNYNNRTDLTYQIEFDPQLITDYNKKNGTSYKMFPEGTCTLEKTTLTIPKNLNEAYFKVVFHKKGLMPDKETYLFGEYIAPIRITTASKYAISPEGDSFLYPISFQPDKIDKKAWKVLDFNSCINEEPQYAAMAWQPEKMLDNDLATFWGSKWDAPKPFPYYFIFDMAKEYSLFRLGYDNPTGANAWRGNAKAGFIEVSTDNKTYKKIIDWEAPNTAARNIIFDIPTTKARYIRFVITSAFTPAGEGARINIAEFNAWGL